MSRILIIEDYANLLKSLQRGLQLTGHEVVTAATGEDGLTLAKSDKVDVVILDLMLPGKSGFDVLAELRSSGFESPILVITAKGAPEDRRRVQELGADGFLLKPFPFADLLQHIAELCKSSSARSAPRD